MVVNRFWKVLTSFILFHSGSNPQLQQTGKTRVQSAKREFLKYRFEFDVDVWGYEVSVTEFFSSSLRHEINMIAKVLTFSKLKTSTCLSGLDEIKTDKRSEKLPRKQSFWFDKVQTK